MKKAINLQAEVQLANTADAQAVFKQSLPKAFAQANPGMSLTIKSLSKVDNQGKAKLRVYLEGEQDPAANFSTLASSALHKVITTLLDNGNQALPSFKHTTIMNLQEVENEEENQDVVLPPPPHTTP